MRSIKTSSFQVMILPYGTDPLNVLRGHA
jgi:hypothetical protein